MSPKPKLSVIIPTLNRPNDLIAVVNSIFDQSYFPNELIIVDQSTEMESYNSVQDLLPFMFTSPLLKKH